MQGILSNKFKQKETEKLRKNSLRNKKNALRNEMIKDQQENYHNSTDANKLLSSSIMLRKELSKAMKDL